MASKIDKTSTTTKKLSELRLWDKNPRGIKKDDFDRLKRQIQRLGIYKPLLINKDNVVLGGNMRLRAYKDLGVEEVEVSIVDADTEAKMLEYALSDNDRAGYYEEQDLAELLQEHAIDIALDDYKIDLGKLSSLQDLLNQFGPDIVEDEPPPLTEEAESKLGEVYQLGRHRLMCGDATKIEDVEKLMDGKKADMVFTDPPYGLSYQKDLSKEEAKVLHRRTDGLEVTGDETTEAFALALPNIVAVCKNGASYYVCCPPGNNFTQFSNEFEKYLYQSRTLIWVKNRLVLGRSDYHYQHEPILYGWNKEGNHQFYGGRDQTTIWNIDRPNTSKEHPTMKPLALVAKAIKNSSKEEDIITDLFGGSGSTLIAAEQTNRVCYIMELDPKYCDVIRKDMKTLTKLGRPTSITADIETKLESILKIGGTIAEATSYAGIGERTYYDRANASEEFSQKMEAAKHYADIVAKNVVVDAVVKDKDLNTAKWWLEKRVFNDGPLIAQQINIELPSWAKDEG